MLPQRHMLSLNLFISWKNQVLFLRYSFVYILNHSFKFWKVLTSWWLLAEKVEYILYWISLLNHKLFFQDTSPTEIYLEAIISGNIWTFGGLGPTFKTFLIYQPNIIKQSIIMSLWFLIEAIKNSKHFLKINWSHNIAILSKSEKGQELVSIRQKELKRFGNFCYKLH